MAVAITRTGLLAEDLRRAAARTRDAKAARRMLAIALVLEGRPAYDAILDACCGAWDRLTREPERLASITSRSWAKAVVK